MRHSPLDPVCVAALAFSPRRERGCQIDFQLNFLLNGEAIRTADEPAQTTLLDYLRSRGLTGTKEGCAEGECGACAVALVCAGDKGGAEYRAVNSCLVWVPMMAGREVWTVEGISRAGLTEPQRALAEAGGSQCGYCTPGFAMSLFAEYYRPDRRGACDPLAMAGNLCRCTGYGPIREAALRLGPAPEDGWGARLREPVVVGAAAQEGFVRPGSLADAWAALSAPGAVAVAGATDLAVESNLKFKRWPAVVSLEAIPEFREFSETDDRVVIGAALPLVEVQRLWRGAPAAVHEWFELFASPLIRNRATFGGNLATASPVGDSAPLLLALAARVRLASVEGEREVDLAEFFTGYRQTVLRPGELIRSVVVPKPLPRFQFYKVSKRRLDDISTIAAALAEDRDGNVRLAWGGMAATPVRARRTEAVLAGQGWSREAVDRAKEALKAELTPLSDHRGSAAYRSAVASRLMEKFAQARERGA